ncbi:MRN complex-interacting protein isoform X1 [Artibeus jamaicensis]|uniref:MRN complex-interacting protein isoform X1 n=1 Tax=Artibeus jamaicensis TaxID=9417 RepID=UPI00235B0AEF|nr:MRN complex-interacting protein isoform X1 [Artibeus jamaicensis]
MEPPPQARVLRCCCCHVFQAHQVKKSLKWTCKVCGEQQSFLRAYGEGSGADCRRHVQKLNLLQAQLLETPHRSPEEPTSAGRERNAGPGPAELVSAQEEPQPSRNRWWKYLERGSGEQGLPGALQFSSWSSSTAGKPDAPSRTRRWSQSAVQPPHSPTGQDVGDPEVTSETQKLRPAAASHRHLVRRPLDTLEATVGHTGLARKARGSSHEDWDARGSPGPGRAPQCAAQQVRATPSKWAQFLPPPGHSTQADTEPWTPLQSDPVLAGAAQAGQEAPQPSNNGQEPRTTSALQLPWATHAPRGPKRPFGVTTEQLWDTGPQAEGRPLARGAQESQLVRLHDLFNTGEDFDDIL